MKKSIKLTLILTILITNLATYAQQQMGVKINGGLSKITISSEIVDNPFETHFVPSGQAGAYYHLPVRNAFSLGAELLFSQIEGKDRMEYDLTDLDGNIEGHVKSIGYRHISYLSLPVYFGVTVKKLTLNAGFQLSYAFSSSGRTKSNGTFYEQGQEQSYSSDSKSDNINIKIWDFGPRAGIIYPLTKRLDLEGTYYYGLNNIQKGEDPMWKLKAQQITLGVRYALSGK